MEEVNAVQENPERPHPNLSEKKRASLIRLIMFSGIGFLVLSILYSVFNFFISPDLHIQQIYLVPDDAVFIIHSSEPVNDWKKLSESEPWKCLTKASHLKEISEHAALLDSIVRSNDFLLSLVGKRDMLISIHPTSLTDWDMLLIVDMKKGSKIDLLKDQLENFFKLSGNKVTRRLYKDFNLLEITDMETREIFYLTFIDNHLVASYNTKLIHKAIDGRENPVIGLNPRFAELEKEISGKGLYRMFVNYAHLPDFMKIYRKANEDPLDILTSSMDFAGLYLNMEKERIELKGQSVSREKSDPYVTALLNSGKHTMGAYKIMPARTSVYTHIGIDHPLKFTTELEKILEADDPALFKEYISSRKKLETFFGLSLQENFLSWMAGEFSIAQLEPGLLGKEPEYILAIKANNIREAQKNMELMEKRIRNRSPIRIKKVTYKGYDINYVEMKGFFRLFFGKLFDQFEKPYYTYLGEYVVFSTQPSALLSLVEDYEQQNLMLNHLHFKKAFARFNMRSTFFVFTNTRVLFPQLQLLLNEPFRKEMADNKEVLYSFPYSGIQFTADGNRVDLHYLMEYNAYDEEREAIPAEKEEEENEGEGLSEKEVMNELKRFYVEKFQGNVLREFYPDGQLKSETEVKEGRKHGRYREYHKNGKLSIRGKYVNNKPRGNWKYYTEEGKFDNKQKY